MVADALHIRDHLHGRGNGPQVPGHGLLLNEQLEADVLDFLLLLVDVFVLGHDPLGGFHILVQEGVGGILNGGLDHRAHVGHFLPQQPQLGIELDSHQPNLPVM